MERLYINPRYQKFLAEHDVATLDKLLADNVQGVALERGSERNTYRLELAGQGFFLKQIYKKRNLQALESVLQLRQPHHYAWREMQHALNLQAEGVDVMPVAAAGERTHRGLPVASAILVEQVEGQSLDTRFAQADSRHQHLFLRQLGALTGRLHLAGFFGTVRMKDVIVDAAGKYVLIDREVRNPHPKRFRTKRAVESLRRFMHRQRRDFPLWQHQHSCSYLDGYLDQAGHQLSVTAQQLLSLID
jgi:tRNA A-37 threonylcarbamoyl transferase component Bud32